LATRITANQTNPGLTAGLNGVIEMPTVQENIKRLGELEAIVEKHLIGGKFKYNPTHALIIAFDLWSGFNGVQVSLDKGKINALEIMINKLDELYNADNHWRSNFKPIKSI